MLIANSPKFVEQGVQVLEVSLNQPRLTISCLLLKMVDRFSTEFSPFENPAECYKCGGGFDPS